MPLTDDRPYWLAWQQMPRVGPVLIRRLHQEFGSLEAAWMAPKTQLGRVEGFGPKLLALVSEARSQLNPQEFFENHCQANPQFWIPTDPDYPALLRELPGPPPLLYYRGAVDRAEMRGEPVAIAIVGTRNPTEYGRRWARRLSTALTKNGFTVVSGLAEGIDGEAHSSCLQAGGRTIAVLGTGVDVVYPWRNRALHQDIAQRGLILSEFPAGTQPDRTHFPQRNRIVAGLCRAVIVVEAPPRSGALITANVANEFCRDVYVVPGTLDNRNARGCLELIGQGAQVILDEEHLLGLLGTMPPLDGAVAESSLRPEPPPNLPEALRPVFEAIAPETCSFDRIVHTTQLPAGNVSSALVQLELLGLITELPGKQYQRLG